MSFCCYSKRKQQHISNWIIKSPENRRGAWEAALKKHLKAQKSLECASNGSKL